MKVLNGNVVCSSNLQNAQQNSHFSETYKQPPALSVLKKKNCSLSVELFCKELTLRELNFAVLSFRENSYCLRFTYVETFSQELPK